MQLAVSKTNWTESSVRTEVYTMNFGTLAAPTMSPGTGTYTSSVTVTLDAAIGTTIRYTTDGSTPTEVSLAYVAPLTLAVTTTLKARAFRVDYTPSDTTTGTYTIVVAAPTFNPGGGSYVAGQAITVSTATTGATITYTTNGADPTQSDATISSGGTLIVGNFTLKAKAWKTGATASAITSAVYTVTGSLSQPRVAGGFSHSLAVRTDGVPWAWGANSTGQLGDGTTTPRLLPVLVNGGTGITAVVGGTGHSLARRSDGAVFAWGQNTNGHLGDGTTTQRLVPVAVSGLTSGVLAVTAGTYHSAALKSDGTIVTWGLNSSGQLGDGTTTQRLIPTAIAGLTGMTAVSARADFTIALKGDGTVWAWGSNAYGQLGDGTTTQRLTPVQVSGLTSVIAIAAGGFHALAVKSDGTVWAWGLNNAGQLGDGTTTQRLTPVPVASVTAASSVAAGWLHSLILKSDGTVAAFGANDVGQLGDGTLTNRSTAVTPLGLPAIAQVAAGGHHSLAVTSDGVVWTWGYNADGQLSDSTTQNRSRPTAISGPGMAWTLPAPLFDVQSGTYTALFNVVVTSIDPTATIRYTTNGVDPTAADPIVASGGSVAITQSLTLKASAWKTGFPTSVATTAIYVLKAVTPVLSPTSGSYATPQTVSMSTTTSGATIRYTLDGTEPTSSSTAYTAPIIIGETLTVKAVAFKTGWANSDSGFASYWISAGTVATPTFSPVPGTYTTPPLVALATATSGASIRYTLDGSDPSSNSRLYVYPFVLTATTTVKARAFKAGFTASAVASGTYAVDATGAVATPTVAPGTGRYATRQTVTVTGPPGATLRYTTTGIDPIETDTVIASGGTITVDRSLVLKVRGWQSGLSPSAVRRADYVVTGTIAAGELHSLALKADRTVWAWGENSSFQIGNGDTSGTDRLTPVQVLSNTIAIAAGLRSSVAVKDDGTAWFWGNGTLLPTQVSGITNAVAVAAGANHVLALKADGTVWAWGANNAGQLGDGTTLDHSIPAPVTGLSGVTAIAAGGDFSLALGSDGARGGVVWAWGVNGSGQLGDGSTLTRTRPVSVVTLSSMVAIAAGSDWALALKTDGTVWSWGANASGQLGNGTTVSSSTPVRANPLSNIVSVASGAAHALAFGTDGRLWAWGNNQFGQLGSLNDVSGPSWVPQLVPVLNAPVTIAAGAQHSLAVQPSGAVYAFGANSSGQLGNGTTASSIPPIPSGGFTVATNTWLSGDADADTLITWREYLLGTDPLNPDTNGNGIRDDVEAGSGGSGDNPDIDADGLANWTEIQIGTDPFRADTDGDGVNDGADAFPLDPTRWLPLTGTPGDVTPPEITLTEPTNAILLP